jgi:SOS-response transcriptional repressor LexA
VNEQPSAECHLTASDLAVYAFIEQYYSLNGYSPSNAEIGKALTFVSADTPHYHVARLLRCGWLRGAHNVHRTLVPIHYPRVYYVERKRT